MEIDWRQLFAPQPQQEYQPGQYLLPPSGFAPPQFPQTNFSMQSPPMQSPWPGIAPQFSGGMSMPAFGGQVDLRGSYFRPQQQAPLDWSALLGFKRQF